MFIMYFIFSFFRGSQTPKPTDPTSKAPTVPARNIFPEGTLMNLYIYLSENETMDNFHPSNLFWYKEGLKYGDWSSGPNKDGSYIVQKDVPITPHMRNNGSLFLHAFVTKVGLSPDPKSKNFAQSQMTSTMKQINR